MAEARFSEEFWTDPKFRHQSIEIKLLAIYLFTNPHRNYCGLYYLPKTIIATETGLSDRSIDRGLDELSNLGFLEYSDDYQVIWVKNMLKRQIGRSENLSEKQEKGIINQLLSLHNTPLIQSFLDRYAYLNLPFIYKVSDTPFKGVPIPSRARSQSKSQSKSKSKDIVNSDTQNGLSMIDLVEIWNQLAPVELARVRLPFTRPENKMRRLKTIVKRHPEKEWWKELISLLRHRPFVLGDNDRGWKITFDKLLEDSELIMDGKYLDRRAEAAIKPRSVGCPVCGRWIEKCICKSKTEVRND